jgi:Fic family protein
MESLKRAQIRKKELDLLRPLSPDQEQRIMQKFRLDWNYHSNNIEGNSLNYGETKALLLHNITAQGKPLKDHIEIKGHNEAILWIEDIVRNEKPLTETFIRELHKLILKEPYEVDAITVDGNPTKKLISIGEYKSTPNHVKTKTGEIFHFASPEETPGKMGDLINWYHTETTKVNFDPIIIASLFHYKFIRIHPFDDGNGRTVRILMNFILMKFGFPPVIIKVEDKLNYYSVLQQADGDNLDPFFDFIAFNLVRSLELMIKAANGESIEEPDDIDKEIGLLELKLKSISKRVEKVRSKDTLAEFSNEVLPIILKSFFEGVNSFQSYFIQQSFKLTIDKSIWDDIKSEDQLENTIKSNIILMPFKISVVYSLFEMRYTGFETYGLNIELVILLNRNNVEISTYNYNNKFLYDEEILEKELFQIKRGIKVQGLAVIHNFIEQVKNQNNTSIE